MHFVYKHNILSGYSKQFFAHLTDLLALLVSKIPLLNIEENRPLINRHNSSDQFAFPIFLDKWFSTQYSTIPSKYQVSKFSREEALENVK